MSVCDTKKTQNTTLKHKCPYCDHMSRQHLLGKHIYHSHRNELKASFSHYKDSGAVIEYPFVADKRFHYCFSCLTWWNSTVCSMTKARTHFNNAKCDVNDCKARMFELLGIEAPKSMFVAQQTPTEFLKEAPTTVLTKAKIAEKKEDNYNDLHARYNDLKGDNEANVKRIEQLQRDIDSLKKDKQRLEAYNDYKQFLSIVEIDVLKNKLDTAKRIISEIPGNKERSKEIDRIGQSDEERDKIKALLKTLKHVWPDNLLFVKPAPEIVEPPPEIVEPAPEIVEPPPIIEQPAPVIEEVEDDDDIDDWGDYDFDANKKRQEEEEAAEKANQCSYCLYLIDPLKNNKKEQYRFTCDTCKQLRHSANDLGKGCYKWMCDKCDVGVCLDCVKKNGGNKSHPCCSKDACRAVVREAIENQEN